MSRGGTTHWVLSRSDEGPMRLRGNILWATGPNIPEVTSCSGKAVVEEVMT